MLSYTLEYTIHRQDSACKYIAIIVSDFMCLFLCIFVAEWRLFGFVSTCLLNDKKSTRLRLYKMRVPEYYVKELFET